RAPRNREHTDVMRRRLQPRGVSGWLLQDHMGVGAGPTKRADRCHPWRVRGLPSLDQLWKLQPRASYFNVWVQFRKMEIRRDRAVLEHERRLDQSDDAGSALEMADVGLDGADVAGFSVSVG